MFNLNKRVLKQALDMSPLATVIVDLKSHPQPVVFVNQAFEAVSGYEAGELIGHPWAELLTDGQGAAVIEPGMVKAEAYLNCHPRLGVGDVLRLDMVPVFAQPGAPRYWVGTESPLQAANEGEDDAERDAVLSVLRDAQMRLRSLDGRDSASGVLNRRAFDDTLQRDWLMARRSKQALSLIVLQIDGFKDYREVFGKHAADSCLAKVGHAITGTLKRAGDLTARYSDDQFVALVGNASEKDALRLADMIATKVRGLSIHHPHSPVDRFVTVSYSVASGVPSADLEAADLVDKASSGLALPANNSGLSFKSV
jgi:diguanylate cyclase (GGDEF)-like protein